jgi:hypothetical protein
MRLLRTLYWSLAAFELLRFLAWLAFIIHLAGGAISTHDRANELLVFVHVGVFYLGFPYSWFGVIVFEDLSPRFVVFVGFLSWAIGTIAALWYGRRLLQEWKTQ